MSIFIFFSFLFIIYFYQFSYCGILNIKKCWRIHHFSNVILINNLEKHVTITGVLFSTSPVINPWRIRSAHKLSCL